MQGIYSNFFFFFFQLSTQRSLILLLAFWLLRTFVSIMTFLLTNIIFDVSQVFGLILVFCSNLSGIDSNYLMALSTISLMIFLLVFFGSLGLRLIGIINRNKILDRLTFISISMISISIVFFWLIYSLLDTWSQFSLLLIVVRHHFFPQIQMMSLNNQLCLNRKMQPNCKRAQHITCYQPFRCSI